MSAMRARRDRRGTRAALVVLALALGPDLDPAPGEKVPAPPTAHWPQFRGPGGAGVAPGPLPVTWSATTNVAWVTAIPGRGWSSPIVWQNRVFVTSATRAGEFKEPSPGIFGDDYIAELMAAGLSRQEAMDRALERDIETSQEDSPAVRWTVYGLDLESGAILWRRTAHSGRPSGGRHRKNTYASETPTTDGERVYAYFGNVGVFAYSLDGEPLWHHRLEPHKIYLDFGTGASPIVDEENLYILNDNEEDSYLLALDKKTGREVWRVERSRKPNSSGWATPFLWRNEVRTEIVSVGLGQVISYDRRGQELWRLAGIRGVAAPTPLAGAGLLFVSSGSPEESVRPLYALYPGARGSVATTPATGADSTVAWLQERGGAYIPSPLYYEGVLYVLYDRGFLAAFDATTGERLYRRRIGRGAHTFTSSPWAAAGRVYCLSEAGDTFVVAAGPELRILHTNSLDEMSLATPAVAGTSLLIRTRDHLYRVVEGPRSKPPGR